MSYKPSCKTPYFSHSETSDIEMLMVETLTIGKNLTFRRNFGFEPKALKPTPDIGKVPSFPIPMEFHHISCISSSHPTFMHFEKELK